MTEPGPPPQRRVPAPETGRSPEVSVAPSHGIPGLHRFAHQAMATVFEIYTVHADRGYAAQAAQAAFDLLDQLEEQLSRFIPNSDIARVNGLAAGGEVRVGPAALECLAIARHVSDLTRGAFDPSLGSGLQALDVHEDGTVRAGLDGIRLDLGAIGKGYAVDRMAEVVEDWDLGPSLVHGGFSSVLALEAPAGRAGWPLTLSDPSVPSRVLQRLEARQTALAASGLRRGDHIRDPRSGGPVRGRRAAWGLVPRIPADGPPRSPDAPRPAAATVADALTTAFMLMAPAEIQALCDASPGLEAWVLPAEAGSDGGLQHFLAADCISPGS